jgi:5-methylcytosine-specific restriction protein A
MPAKIPTYRPPGAGLAHKADARAYDMNRRDPESRRFYSSKAWRKMRALVLAEEPLCRDCSKAGRLELAVHVHHEVEYRQAPELGLERSNLTPLCLACHNRRRHVSI